MNKIFGIKGFDKDLKCKDFQYEIGKTYEMPESPKLCFRGFHYCQTINDVFQYYRNDGNNRFCIVEILGDVDKGNDKSATNKIKVVSELSKEEIKTGSPNITPEILKNYNNMGYIIGGSMALKIHGYKIDRTITEIDLIINEVNQEKIEKDFNGYKTLNVFSGSDSVFAFTGIMGTKFDIIKSKDKIDAVKRDYYGFELLIQDENVIWEAKLTYALNGSIKHAKDIKLNSIDFKMKNRSSKIYCDDSLPF